MSEKISVDRLVVSDLNERQTEFDPEAGGENMIEKVRARDDVDPPLKVRPTDKKGYDYEIYNGSRNFNSACEVGIEEVSCDIEEDISDLEVMKETVTSNTTGFQKPATVQERAAAMRRLWREMGNDDLESASMLSDELGVSESKVRGWLEPLHRDWKGTFVYPNISDNGEFLQRPEQSENGEVSQRPEQSENGEVSQRPEQSENGEVSQRPEQSDFLENVDGRTLREIRTLDDTNSEEREEIVRRIEDGELSQSEVRSTKRDFGSSRKTTKKLLGIDDGPEPDPEPEQDTEIDSDHTQQNVNSDIDLAGAVGKDVVIAASREIVSDSDGPCPVCGEGEH